MTHEVAPPALGVASVADSLVEMGHRMFAWQTYSMMDMVRISPQMSGDHGTNFPTGKLFAHL